MSIAPVKRPLSRGFTLLEITLAMAILGMMSLAIYRFVASNLIVLRVSSEENAAEARYSGFIHLITAQLQDLPAGAGALSGETYKFNEQSRDEITWICGSGPGLLTRYAPGEFIVSMRLRPVNEGSGQMEIGFNRKPRNTAEGSTEGESWVSLLDDVRSMQVRYFDSRLNVWVERWTDTITLPPLVSLTIGRSNRGPREAVIALRRTPRQLTQQAQPTPPTQPGQPGQPGQPQPGQAGQPTQPKPN
jgi:prepilin-type N-terminal cleavage/methylation domain-containing protein